jgi:hypothetical protein
MVSALGLFVLFADQFKTLSLYREAIECWNKPRAAGALPIHILSPKTAGLKHNRVSVDVIPEPKAAQSQAILPFPTFDIRQVLDRVMATAVI